ncbi:protein of unknown function [Burkholderia sp. CF099]|nr:protein of unknown function [Burkholderia sp. CF099]
MNIKIIAAFVVAAAISAPAFAATDTQAPSQQPVVVAAQSGGLTRAQVRAELVALQKAGYGGEDVTYPTQIQAAEARVAAQKAAAGSQGGVGSGSEASGSRTVADRASIDDVKPASFGQ